ncbi:abortive infection protein [Clostridium carboxidivorans P7]|uniref:Abortive infection protein n=1 Tax=Clostridium carboxidivorans P7 TaxID=536227 RepID=C6PUF8_9CLOT|nr:type II CAAX endopeptidase family protein [Clostridium carboxidivorans]AKN30543.1 abortive infection protein [Clostridium carboxidivorans P7]EET87156.1 Abortive infection protein [Clostridium carboxidivorans P7]EFG86289.1 CAAX amino terminal protease family protein [Clostridium carboxidivorans P7]
MNEKTKNLNGKAVIPTMSVLSIICLVVGISFIAIPYFTNGKNIKSALQTWSNFYIYYLAVILLVMLPFYLKDLKKRGVSPELLKKEIIDKNKLIGDILFGLLGGILTFIITVLIVSFTPIKGIGSGQKDLTPILIQFLTLVIIAPLVKEIVFRLYSKLFLEEKYGMLVSVLISNIIFGVFDWHTTGISFIAGLLWYAFYIKRRRLIVPIVAHGSVNLISIICSIIS